MPNIYRNRIKAASTLLACAMATAYPLVSMALPEVPSVAHGSAAFDRQENVLKITNSNGAIINWQSFNIAADERIKFIQPSTSSAVLNRVVTASPSQLHGTLSSNGRVWLINPAGILVGAGAQIDTAGFVASSLPVTDADFLAGKLTFRGSDGPLNSSVSNQGEITTPEGGHVYLIGAASALNAGLIETKNGEAILAAGETVRLIDTGTPGVRVEVTGNGTTTNLGRILTEVGRIGLAGAILNNSGTVSASLLVRNGERLLLVASEPDDDTTQPVEPGASGTEGATASNESADSIADNGKDDDEGSGNLTESSHGDDQKAEDDPPDTVSSSNTTETDEENDHADETSGHDSRDDEIVAADDGGDDQDSQDESESRSEDERDESGNVGRSTDNEREDGEDEDKAEDLARVMENSVTREVSRGAAGNAPEAEFSEDAAAEPALAYADSSTKSMSRSIGGMTGTFGENDTSATSNPAGSVGEDKPDEKSESDSGAKAGTPEDSSQPKPKLLSCAAL